MATGRDPEWMLPPDTARLRILERYCELQLAAIRQKIAEAEAAEQETEAARARAQASAVPPEWLIQYGIGANRAPMLVHTGQCATASGRLRPASRTQVLDVLRHPQVSACGLCGADAALDAEP